MARSPQQASLSVPGAILDRGDVVAASDLRKDLPQLQEQNGQNHFLVEHGEYQ